MNVFFTGCTHFDHANIIKLANRPFTDVHQMNSLMVERWNAKVGKNDLVYHLGDFSFSRDYGYQRDVWDSLNGNKVLVQGNHDLHAMVQYTAARQLIEVQAHGLPGRLILCHYPIEEWNGYYKGWWHLHAHTHSHDKRGANPKKGRVNVTVEAWGYAPASVEEIREVWPTS